jgi:peptidyl-prolyl cis-trans isomerase D
MLDILRANARSALTYVLFGIIIVVFVVSFGPGSCGAAERRGGGVGGAPTGTAATVNGEEITAAELEEHYAQLYRAYQQQAGEGFTRELAERLGLRKVALDQLVERTLVRQEAERRGIVVGDEDVERAVVDNPAFQAGGRFDRDAYLRAVRTAYGSPGRFERQLRDDLAVQKMVALLRQTAKVSDEDVRAAWLAENDEVNLELVRFPLDRARAEANVPAADVEAFARANDERVRKAFEENEAKYDQPRRAKARHVLVKVDAGAPEAAVEEARKEAEGIAERAKKGEDFAKLAQELSDDAGTKDRGGDLGSFGEGVMAKPFEDAVFAAKPGDVVGPVQTTFGFHVIRVEELQEARDARFDDVKHEVARDLLEAERAKELARRRAEEALAAARGGRSLADLFPPEAPGRKPVRFGGEVLAAEETGIFDAADGALSIPHVGAAPELLAAALAASGPQLLPQVFETPAGPLVARVKERRKPDPAQLEGKRDEVAARLRARREREVEQAFVQALRQRGEVEVNEQLAGAGGLAALGQ